MDANTTETVAKEPIAIVGLGCVLPDAPDVTTFWDNLLSGRNSIREVPRERWDPDLFWSADKTQTERTYAKIGAFVAEDAFNGLDYRMPPKTVEQIDPSQRWALAATRQALLDAGLKTGLKADDGKTNDGKELRDFDRTRCAVILGNAMGGEQMKLQAKNLYWPQVERALREDADFQSLPAEKQDAVLWRAKTRYQAGVPPVTEDSMPGTLSNVAAGRVANVFDLSGKNFTTDAACASSLAALDAAVDCLRKEECDLVVWGGTDRSMDVTPFVEFSRIGALSPDGSRPFDKDANGFVMGEGCAILVLKRLFDAERDGDKVYAVVRGVGGSSDGKGKGITAPNPAGQVKAVLRAYQDAAVDPFTLGYLEAHGTSTPVGDPVELTSAEEAFRALSDAPHRPGSILVGSVKSNMGHLKSAAGAVGLLKAALALKNGRIPPSIHVKTLNPRIEWAKSPFKVATTATEWPRPQGHPRRAAVSSFGFGGTNFHVVLEEHIPGRLKMARPTGGASAQTAPTTPAASPAAPATLDLPAFQAAMEKGAALEAEALVLDGATAAGALTRLETPTFAADGTGKRVRDIFAPLTRAGVAAPTRVAFAVEGPAELPKKAELAQKAATNPAAARLAFNQGVFLGRGDPKGKIAFLFPGQGTQYVNMLRDLAAKYEVVRNAFHEADEVLVDDLGGIKLTDILWPEPDTPEARAAAEEKLKLTEYTQPAVLAADVAILRLLQQWGIKPDVVAGHSLGEYGALVAAGVLSFADALHAVAARGREMANVEVPDHGKMAAVAADWETVKAAIADVTEYVIPANKNCPSQTVLAGSSPGVDAAVAKLKQKGLDAQYLPVSAAFHSEIVAPASAPLRRVLARLDVQPPRVRILSNVGAAPYPDDPEAIRDNLAKQIAHPVEWIDIIERMHAEGVTTFIEVGPKRALTGFVMDILGDRAVAICSNHPKKGGIQHINEMFAFLGAWGYQPAVADLNDPTVYTAGFRDPAAPFRRPAATVPPPTDPRIDILAAGLKRLTDELDAIRGDAASSSIAGSPGIARSAGSAGGQAAAPGQGKPAAPALPPAAAPDAARPSRTAEDDAAHSFRRKAEAFGICLDDIGVAGISVGLPGSKKDLFDEGDWDRIIRGENLIDTLSEQDRAKLTDKNIIRLVKGPGGEARFQVIDDVAQVIHLAGRRGRFDIAEYGVGEDLASVLDDSFQYAIAAGIEALRDAGIPLQRTYAQTSTGGYLPKEWKLPAPLRDETGIIFASAFPGFNNLVDEVSRHLADKYAGRTLDDLQSLYEELIQVIEDDGLREKVEAWFEAEFGRLQEALPGHGAARYEFNRKFLFRVLSMGHSQLAQFIGARGPNTQVNAACSSTTQALAIAEDWIRTGRARRIIVVGADDITTDTMFPYIGAGFLASGAATTKARVEDAALPFDRRRHGMIVGMGAVGLVVEAIPETERRGMRPIAKMLATRASNSAFHGSRLDVEHIAGEMRAMLLDAKRRYGVDPEAIAEKTLFMSHETYTPARGGSASAEIHGLRAGFGAAAHKVIITNTKGFTGHPQGAGIEDAIALKCLQRGRVPPIANFREPDPELGDLNLSRGGEADVRYALRMSAGFGSQLGLSLMELVARENERVADQARYDVWLATVSGIASPALEVQNRTLRIVDQGPPKAEARPQAEPAPAMPVAARESATAGPASAGPTPPASAAGAWTEEKALARLIALVAAKTGYPTELLDPDLDMEADLGIDTVKQAELFGLMREELGVPLEDGLQIKDYPSLRKVAGYMAGRASGSVTRPPTDAATTQKAPPTPPASAEARPAEPASTPPAAVPRGADVLDNLIALVAQKTGYPTELLDPDLDMEADLGIDTVKQAELFGLMREQYALPLEEGLQIKDYPSLRKVAGYFAERAGGAMPAAPPAPTDPPTPAAPIPAGATGPAATAAPTRTDAPTKEAAAPASSGTTPDAPAAEAVLAFLTDLVAAKTGYPADMLEPDLDLEADLGIDTVKQAELFGLMREHYALPLEDGLQIKDYPSLRKVAGYFARAGQQAPADAGTTQGKAAMDEGAAPRTGPAAAPPSASAPAPADAGIVRRVPSLRPEDRPGTGPALARGPVLVVGDADAAFLDAWRTAGFEPTHKTGDCVGILCLATRADPAQAAARMGALFEAAKAHPDAGFVCVATAQDGAHGLREVRDPGMAALAGLAKALRKELPEATVKATDVHPGFDGAPRAVVEELLHGGPRTEVCYDATGRRHVVEVAPDAIAADGPDVAGRFLVVSGGAQGITVEMLAALAPQAPRLLLLGRTVVPEEAAAWASWDDAAWKAREQEEMAALKERGDRVTPVALKKALEPLRKAADVHRNVERVREAGADVRYVALDVTDAAAVSGAVDAARRTWGPVQGIIHAAGVEVSKELADKDRAQFDLVTSVKMDGWNALMDACRDDPLEILVGFGSVAGRFGNLGQVDYSAANEWLAKAVKAEGTRRGCRVATTIAWGPWGEVGMATRGSIMQVMKAAGVTPIPTAEGVAHFLRELAAPGIRECVVAGTLGAIDADAQVVASAWDPALDAARARLAEEPQRFRLLRAVTAARDGAVEVSLVVDRDVDPYLDDHSIDGVPYLPGVFAIEAFAQAGSLVADGSLLGADDVRFASPLKQLKGPVEATITAVREDAEENGDDAVTRVACRMTTRFVAPDGKVYGEPRLHFEATLRYGRPGEAPTTEAPACDGTVTDIYPPFFHGPSFQVLAAAGPIADGGTVGSYRHPTEPHFGAGKATYLSHPMLNEALFQLCGLRTLLLEQRMSLPNGIERLDVYEPADEAVLWCRFTGKKDVRRFDAVACTPAGRVVARMVGYTMIETGPAPEPTAPKAPEGSAPGPSPATEPGSAAAPAAGEATIQTADVALPELDGVVFAAVAVVEAPAEDAFFTAAERRKHTGFKAPKRAAEWRAGRLAAKAAAQMASPGLDPHDVVVEADKDGRPHLIVDGRRLEVGISITHRDGLAIAALGEHPVGIDLETVEPRPQAFLDESFTEAEQKRLPATDRDVHATCMWAAKEAAFKRAGTGLQASLRQHEVHPDGSGGAVVEGPLGTFGVRFYDVAGQVLAVSLPEFDPATAQVGPVKEG